MRLAQRLPAEQALDTLTQFYRDQPDDGDFAAYLSAIYVAMGEKDLALEAAERAITALSRVKDAAKRPTYEENLAFIQANIGENGRAISTLTQLLQTPYFGWILQPSAHHAGPS
jgi:tetratricopeptide (TPR) repeat protein